jgi:hypothetical protein
MRDVDHYHEIMPRPMQDDGTLVIEGSRMRLLSPHGISFLKSTMGGYSVSRLAEERGISEAAVYSDGHDVLEAMDIRTWGEAARIGIENGMIEVPLREGFARPGLDREAAEFLAMSTRGVKPREILTPQGIPLYRDAIHRRKEALMTVFDIPTEAYAPYAAITYEYYRRGFSRVPADAARRLATLKQHSNLRRFLGTTYPEAGFTRLPDRAIPDPARRIMNILSLAGITPESRKYQRLVAYLEQGMTQEEISQAEPATFKAVETSIAQARTTLRNFTDVRGFLSLTGVEVELPMKRVPPLSWGLSRNRR